MAQFRVVDVGSKLGGSAAKYGQNVKSTVFGGPNPKPAQICCIERAPRYEPKLKALGFSVLIADVFALAKNDELPYGDVYLASNMLEHCPCVDASMYLLEKMMRMSRQGVWLRLPSFEQDETGEGRLARHNLRFNWTSWRGHWSHFRLAHVYEALHLLQHQRPMKIHVSGGRLLHDSNYPNIVPNLDTDELVNYDPRLHGPRNHVKFKPPIVGEWDVQIQWT